MELEHFLKQLKLPSFAANYNILASNIEQNGLSVIEYLKELTNLEIESRAKNKVQRLVKYSGINCHKSLAEFITTEVPNLSPSKLHEISCGGFIDKSENLLIFGPTGTGKTHLCSGFANKWCISGKKVYYTKASKLMTELAAAQLNQSLPLFRKRLDRNDVIIIDDLLYHEYTRTEVSLLMSLVADYYETKSLVITSHLPFIKWKNVLHDELTAITIVDRLIHHSIILELDTESYRVKYAKRVANKNNEGKEEIVPIK